ncbi:hypothetical protein EZS27_022647 [termite gut metagenome]|uniref:Uncharacterized protein n=1 Tax=termite gut metagenome TaxID=433724 RepID=A0A5J4R5S9_9ZZZZ
MLEQMFTERQFQFIRELNCDNEKTRREKLEALSDFVYEAIQIADEYEEMVFLYDFVATIL